MFSSQFDDNPFAEEVEAETLSPGPSGGGENITQRTKRQREDSPPKDVSAGKMARFDDAPGEEKTADAAEEAAPCIVYSVEDVEGSEGEEGDDADEAYSSLLCRVAEMEATQRESMRAHRFCIMLGKQEKDALRMCMSRLRTALMDLQRKRSKGGQLPTAVAGGCGKGPGIQSEGCPSDFVVLLDAYDGATLKKRLSTRVCQLQRLEKACEDKAGVDYSLTMDNETWMPSSVLPKHDLVSHKPCRCEKWDLGSIQNALEGLLPLLNDHIRQVLTALVHEIRRLSQQCDALRAVSDSIESKVRTLESRWKECFLWGMERSLLVADEQMRSHFSALHVTSAEQEIIRRQQQLRQRLHRTEVAVGAILAASAGLQLPNVPPPVLQTTMRRHEELEHLRNELTQEILYLRKMLRDKLASSSMHAFSYKSHLFTWPSLEEGRSLLLQHSCAALVQRLYDLNEQIVLMVLRDSTVCPSLTQQVEQLCLSEVKAYTQHASIVAFLAENARLQQQVKDAALIKLMASPGSAAVLFLEKKLQAPVFHGQMVEHGGCESYEKGERRRRHHSNNDNSVADGDEDSSGEELDVLRLLTDTFTEGVEDLLQSLNTHLRDVSGLFSLEKQICNEIAFLMRMTVAGDNLVHGKVGVPLPANPLEDSAKELEDVCVSFEHPQRTLQRLPSMDVLQKSLYSYSSRHAAELERESGAAAVTWAELREDVEWCRQQSSKTAESELREARKELQQLKAQLEVVEARKRDPVPLEAELLENRKKLSRLQHGLLILQEELAVVEEEWRLLEREQHEEEGERGEAEAVDGTWATSETLPPEGEEEERGDTGRASLNEHA